MAPDFMNSETIVKNNWEDSVLIYFVVVRISFTAPFTAHKFTKSSLAFRFLCLK